MKTKTIIGVSFLVILALVLIAGCAFFGTSIDKRISLFEGDINNNRSNAWTHWHPDSTAYTSLRAASGWDSHFPVPPNDHDFDVQSTSSDTATVKVSGGFNSYDNVIFYFDMKKDGFFDWYIRRIRHETLATID